MKKILCLVLAAVMIMTAAFASAAEYTLYEKMGKQMQIGSGLKGNLKLFADKDTEDELLRSLSGVEIGFKSISSGDCFETIAYLADGDQTSGTTTVWSDGSTVAIASELLPDVLLTLPVGGDVLNALLQTEGNSPVWYSAALAIMNISDTKWDMEWSGVLEPYFADIELWLAEYASAPVINKADDGSSTILIRYEIPEDAMKEKLIAFISTALQDEALMALVKQQTTDEQAAAYLDPAYLYYYEALIRDTSLNTNIVLERELTSKGEELHTRVILPVAAKDSDSSAWRSLSVDFGKNETSVVLSGDHYIVSADLAAASSEGKKSWNGSITAVPQNAEAEAWSVSFALDVAEQYSVDTDGRQHSIYDVHFTLANTSVLDGSNHNIKEITPVDIICKLHFHGKNANTSPTTLETEGSAVIGLEKFSWTSTAKTAAPWNMISGEISGGTDIRTLSNETLAQHVSGLTDGLIREASVIQSRLQSTDEATAENAENVPVATNTDIGE